MSLTALLVVLIWKVNVPDRVKTLLIPIEGTERVILAARPADVISIAPDALILINWLPSTVAVKLALTLMDSPVLPTAR